MDSNKDNSYVITTIINYNNVYNMIDCCFFVKKNGCLTGLTGVLIRNRRFFSWRDFRGVGLNKRG